MSSEAWTIPKEPLCAPVKLGHCFASLAGSQLNYARDFCASDRKYMLVCTHVCGHFGLKSIVNSFDFDMYSKKKFVYNVCSSGLTNTRNLAPCEGVSC